MTIWIRFMNKLLLAINLVRFWRLFKSPILMLTSSIRLALILNVEGSCAAARVMGSQLTQAGRLDSSAPTNVIFPLELSMTCSSMWEMWYNQTSFSGLVTIPLTMFGPMMSSKSAMLPKILLSLSRKSSIHQIFQSTLFKVTTIHGQLTSKISHHSSSISPLMVSQGPGLTGWIMRPCISLLSMDTTQPHSSLRMAESSLTLRSLASTHRHATTKIGNFFMRDTTLATRSNGYKLN